MLGYRGAGTHPLVSLRSAFTTSFTPRFTCLCLEAVEGGARGVSHEARARGVGRIDRRGGVRERGVCGIGGFPRAGRARTFLDHLEDLLVKADVRQGLGDGAHGAKLPVAAVAVLLDLGRGLVLLLFLVLPHGCFASGAPPLFCRESVLGGRDDEARESRGWRSDVRKRATRRITDETTGTRATWTVARARPRAGDLPPPPTIRK